MPYSHILNFYFAEKWLVFEIKQVTKLQASRFLNDVFKTTEAEGVGWADEGGLQLQFPHTSTRDLYAFLQLAYCGSMEIGAGGGQDHTRKSTLIGVLQMLRVSDDIVVVDSSGGGDDARVNDINLLPGGNQSLADIADETDAPGVPGGTLTLQPVTKKAGTMSLSRVSSKHRPAKTALATSAVTVEFKAKKRPALTPQPPPARHPQLSMVPVVRNPAGGQPPLPKMPALLLPQQPILPQQPLPQTALTNPLPPIVPNPANIGIKGMVTDRY